MFVLMLVAGPLLYALLRFVKPQHVLEIGAGYTSIFMLQGEPCQTPPASARATGARHVTG